jgi:hypothetical protein
MIVKRELSGGYTITRLTETHLQTQHYQGYTRKEAISLFREEFKRPNKYLYGWKIWVNYGQGWEYECFERTWKEAKAQLATYRANVPGIQIKATRGREQNPNYHWRIG